MEGTAETVATWSGELPMSMWVYSFMFEKPTPDLLRFIAEGKLPLPSSLIIGMVAGLAITATRLLLDVAVFKPLARRILGFSALPKQTRVAALDALCSKPKAPSPEEVSQASASTGISQEGIEEYVRVRRESGLQDKQLGKFKEAAWRLLVYSALVVFGVRVSSRVEWSTDFVLLWANWPTAPGDDGLDVYYHCAMGVYWHFIVFQFWETKRSDFTQMLIHHLATLFLLSFSWLMSVARIGVLIMLCHDVSDIFMEAAKLFNYAQKRYPWCHVVADGIFFVFAGVFGFTRLYIFPRHMVTNVIYTDSLGETQRAFFLFLLFSLVALHVFWFYLILRMVYMFVVHGVEEDIREGEDEASNGKPANGYQKSKIA